ncbi:MAG: hypothetical protein KAZ26_24605 [Caldilineaceae bacterium]|nr:hypothetical protein [Caldilineaceae bacterium]
MTINTTNHAAFVPEIWAAQALGYLKANTVMVNLVNKDFQNEIARDGDTINIPQRGSLSVQTKTAGGTFSPESPTGTSVAATVTHKYVSFIVEDIAEAQSRPELIGGYIEDGIKLIGEDIDQAILNLYSGFSTTPIDATAGIAVGSITEARRLLNSAKVPQMDRYIVWHEDAEAEILKLAQFTSAQNDPANATALQNATMGRKFGFAHYMDQQVAVATGEVKNLAFHRDAITLATRVLPAPPAGLGANASTMSEDGIGVRVLWGYNMSYGGVQVNIEILYAVAEMRDNHAVVIRSTEV